MNLQQWRESANETATLPSGLAIEYKRTVDMWDLAANGQIPHVLLAMVSGGAAKEVDFVKMLSEFPELVKSADALIRSSWVSPPVADVGDNEHVGINEIPRGDKLAFLFAAFERSQNLAMGKFRDKSNGNGATPPRQQSIRQET